MGITKKKMNKVIAYTTKSQVNNALEEWLQCKDIFKFAKEIIDLAFIFGRDDLLEAFDIIEAEDRYEAMQRDNNREESNHEIYE